MRLKITQLAIFVLLNTVILSQQRINITGGGTILSFNHYFPSAQIGFQYKLSKKTSILTEFVFNIRNRKNIDSSFYKRQLFRINTEVKYFYKLNNRKGNYLSSELAYIHRRRSNLLGGNFIHKQGDNREEFAYDKSLINSPVFSVAAKIGWEIYRGRLTIDLYAGIGVRYINTTYSNTTGLRNQAFGYPKDLSPIPLSADLFSNKLTRFHLPAGIRLQYQLF